MKKVLFPWQGADGREDAFLAARGTREVSDNLVKYDYISWLGLWFYVSSHVMNSNCI